MMRKWMAYDSVPRRRCRALARLSTASTRLSLYPTARIVPAYWWDGHANFGDALTPWLLPRYGIVPAYTVPTRAHLVGIGSILEQLPSDFGGVIWGSGLLFGKSISLPRAQFLALRGYLTKERLGVRDPIPLGDPGILVSRRRKHPGTTWTLGVVPHGRHTDHPMVAQLACRYPRDVVVINTAGRPGRVIDKISRCSTILSTSLHGLIVADSYSIPALWTQLKPDLYGADFKFLDYESVVTPDRSRRFEWDQDATLSRILGCATLADESCVAQSMISLEEALALVPTVQDVPFLALRYR